MKPDRRDWSPMARLGVGILLVVALGQACGGGRPWGRMECSTLEAKQDVEKATGPATFGRVYLDLSQSMQGYIWEPGRRMPARNLVQYALDEGIEETFRSLDLKGPELFGFSETAEPLGGSLQSHVLPAADGRSARALYSRGQTDLRKALEDAATEESAVSIIVTDGGQDQRLGRQGGRGSGADVAAVAQAVENELIDRRFGLWLVGIQADFDGCYYNVRLDRQGQLGRCLWLGAAKRPLYVWVLSRDLEAGRRWTLSFVHRLQREGEPGAVQVLELMPGQAPVLDLDWEPPSTPRPDGVPPLRPALRERPGPSQILDLKVETRWQRDEVLVMTGHLEPGSAIEELAWPLDAWRFVARLETPQEAEVETRRPSADRLEVELSFPSRLASTDWDARDWEIPVLRSFDASKAISGTWVEAWSTRDDTTVEGVTGKTLYLAELVEAILVRTHAEPEPVACLHVSVQPE